MLRFESHKKAPEQAHLKGSMEDNTVINWKVSFMHFFLNKITRNLLLKAFTLRATWFLALAALCRAVIPSLALKSKCAPPFFRAFITSTVLSRWAAKVRGVSTEKNSTYLEKGVQNYIIKLIYKIISKILFKANHKLSIISFGQQSPTDSIGLELWRNVWDSDC